MAFAMQTPPPPPPQQVVPSQFQETERPLLSRMLSATGLEKDSLTLSNGKGVEFTFMGDAAEAYRRLTPQDQMKVKLIESNFSGDKQVTADLSRLLSENRLQARDKSGQSTLDYLVGFINQKGPAGINKDQAVRELIYELAVPGRNDQRNHGTCAATTIQYIHASERPADFARVVSQLFSEKGDAYLADGSLMVRNPTAIADDHSGRKQIDRIYQASMMDFSNGPKASYDNTHTGTSYKYNGKDLGDGLTDGEIRRGLSAVLGERYEVAVNRGTRLAPKVFQKEMEAQLREGKRTLVSMVWDENPGARDANHAVSVEKFEGDYVFIRNPWGSGERGGKNGPPREIVDQETGLVRIKKQDFFDRLNYGVSSGDTDCLIMTIKHLDHIPTSRATVVQDIAKGVGTMAAVGGAGYWAWKNLKKAKQINEEA